MIQLLACIVALGLAPLSTIPGGGKKAPVEVEGTWTVIGWAQEGGEKLPAEQVAAWDRRVVFKDGKYTDSTAGETVEEGTYALDAGKSPATIDFTVTKGKDQGKKQLGLVKLDGDVLTVALSRYDAKERPRGFDGGDDYFVMTLKRKK